jgi:protein involved in polysaccharide export with SLBB domain
MNFSFLNHKLMVSLCILSMIFSGVINAQDTPSASDADSYVLAAGDVIEVRVYDEADLSMMLSVPTNGSVEYAFVGEFRLLGKTVRSVQKEIHERLLGDYLLQPRVSVSVAAYRDFYVYGEVARPGSFPWQPGLTVRKVLTLAGGLKERASGSKWYLVPEGGNESDRRKVMEDDIVNPGDTITFEQSFF